MDNRTITIQIGNSDDKLSQRQWASFVQEMSEAIADNCTEVHFSGAPANWSTWQNFAWVVECTPAQAENLRARVLTIRSAYRQDSAAWTEGLTQLV